MTTDPRTVGRIDDVALLINDGEDMETAARRLGITSQSLRRWLLDHGHDDLARILTTRAQQRPRGHRISVGSRAHIPEGGGLTYHEVMSHAGITYRQLDYWTRCGLIDAMGDNTPGSGRARFYSQEEADVARTIQQLSAAGLEPRVAARVARQIAAGETPHLGPYALTAVPGGAA